MDDSTPLDDPISMDDNSQAISKDQPHEAHHGEAPFTGPVEAAEASRCFHGILRSQVQGTGQRQPDPTGISQPKINTETEVINCRSGSVRIQWIYMWIYVNLCESSV